jgi:hypothetical protein
MRLIDVLNLIAKGELEEGTKMIYDGSTFVYEKKSLIVKSGGRNTPVGFSLEDLNNEIELIKIN